MLLVDNVDDREFLQNLVQVMVKELLAVLKRKRQLRAAKGESRSWGGNILMKNIFSFILCFICVLTLVACGKKADPITLPQTDEITSIDITVGENTVNHSDKTWINKIITDISSSEPTKKESVQDVPRVERYIKIDFRIKTGIRTLFAYEDSGKYYIEQPYQGIYKIDRQLFERLQETD